MNTNGIIFNCIAAAAKVVFEHLEIAPGTYTAAQIWRALNGSTKEIKSITVNKDIYNYNSANAYYGNNRQEFLENYARESMFYGENGEVWYTKQ